MYDIMANFICRKSLMKSEQVERRKEAVDLGQVDVKNFKLQKSIHEITKPIHE